MALVEKDMGDMVADTVAERLVEVDRVFAGKVIDNRAKYISFFYINNIDTSTF